MDLQRLIQKSAAENVDFTEFINSALNDQLSWEVLGVFLDNLTPTLAKSKDLNKILLQKLKQLNIQLKSKAVEEDPFAEVWVDDGNLANDSFLNETDSKVVLQRTLNAMDEDERYENEVDYDLPNDYFEEYQPLEQNGSNLTNGNHEPLKIMIKPDFDALMSSKKQKQEMKVEPNSDGQFVCKTCGKVYKFKKSFLSHVEAHKISDDLPNDYFEEYQPLDQDPRKILGSSEKQIKTIKIEPNSDGQFVCKICGKIYKFKKAFLSHVEAHKISDQMDQYMANENLFECKICSKNFDIHRAMEYHSKVHDPTDKCFECKLCGKLLRVNRLQDHDEAHKSYVENEDKKKKPFKCPSCPKRFSCYANRLQHRKIHDPNRESYECKVCSKTFVSQIGFKNHEERVCKVGQ